ncbi:hypothetical protein AM588_10000678 [Phytophthora nicotianae]|uniref:Uncharacterized protein n=1 Tax=Phytophthora nicotianae TaxID=4792 RepID=A0A0W8CK35_PHYNI|nr:hypothetical protein AM588_10000678 [Phytophthora nicotianae]
MALTIHYLEEDFTVSSWTLEVEPFPGRHTGVAIAKGLEKIMDRWELRPENCVMLVRDGAANAVCASEILDMRSMSCIAHSLHLVVGGALLKQKKKAGAGSSTPQAQNPTADLDPRFASAPDAPVAKLKEYLKKISQQAQKHPSGFKMRPYKRSTRFFHKNFRQTPIPLGQPLLKFVKSYSVSATSLFTSTSHRKEPIGLMKSRKNG